MDVVWIHPGLVSEHALELMAGELDHNDCAPLLPRWYEQLRSMADRLARGDLRVRLGDGPVERLGKHAEADLTMAAAIGRAREPQTYWDLSTKYVSAAISSLRDQMLEARIGRLVLYSRLTVVAVDALFRQLWGTATSRPRELSDAAYVESLTCLYSSLLVYAELAAEHFMAHRDTRLFVDADRRLGFLCDVLRANGETGALAEVLRRRAVLHAASPVDLLACRTSAMTSILYATSTTQARMPEEAGRYLTYAAALGWQLRFEGSEGGLLDLPEEELGDDASLLAQAREYLDRARLVSGGELPGDVLGSMLHIAVRQDVTETDTESVMELARKVLAAPEPTSAMFRFLAMNLNRSKPRRCVEALEEFLRTTPAAASRDQGLRAAQWAVIEAVDLARQVAPQLVGSLLEAAEGVFPEFSPRRIVLTRLQAEYLVIGDRVAPASAAERQAAHNLLSSGAPLPDDAARLLLAEACLQGCRGDLTAAVDAVRELSARSPSVVHRHPGAAHFLLLTVAPVSALAAQLDGDDDAAREAWLYQLTLACALRYWNIAFPVLIHLLEDVDTTDGACGARVVQTLASCADVLESCMGDPVTKMLQALYRKTMSYFSRAGAPIDDILLTLDLAKGHRFSTALSWSGSPQRQTTTGVAPPELGQVRAPDVGELSEDELWLRDLRERSSLSVPYREDLDLKFPDSQAYELPKRRFDAQIYAAAFATGTGGPSHVSSDLPNLLDRSHLVLDLYLGTRGEGERALFVTACSGSGWTPTTQPIPIAVPRPVSADEVAFFPPLTPQEIDLVNRLTGSNRSRDDVVVKAGDMVALPYAEFLTDLVRHALLSPSGPRSEVRGLHDLLDSTTTALLGPAVEVLKQHFSRGGTKVTVVPHGALRAFPFHLLRLDGEPLAQRCCITYAPTMRSLTIPVGSVNHSGLTAFAYASGDPDVGFPELPDVTGEAAEIAGMFGVKARVDHAATASAFLGALETSRYVHIATHSGVDTVPSFHHLVTAPETGSRSRGRMYAFQILDHDLRGVELVTLSACTTSLIRFDTADNPRGIVANLLLKGARFVVGALWPVRTEVAHHFFVELYRGIRSDLTVPDAFWAAQQATRARYSALRDWGVFALIGSRTLR